MISCSGPMRMSPIQFRGIKPCSFGAPLVMKRTSAARPARGIPVSYVITAYNDMAKIRDPAGGEALLIGIEAFIPPRASIAAGHSLVDVGYGRLEAGGWYLVRRVNGHYDLRQLPGSPGSSRQERRAAVGLGQA
jgi:hypothetical protein